MNKRPFSTDEETAIALCRTTYSGDCRCERNGTVICEPMLRVVVEMQPALSQLRAAIALPTPHTSAADLQPEIDATLAEIEGTDAP
jgi:hypothetical protein